MSVLQWTPLVEEDLDGLVTLARDCLAADGGLPQLGTPELIRELFLTGPGIVGRDDSGDIVAAAALFQLHHVVGATGLVHPQQRRQGHGEQLVSWCRAHSSGQPAVVVAETMSQEAESLFASSGLKRTFAETVMRHDLEHIPRARRPEGVRTLPFDDDTAPLFFAAHLASFADRSGFDEGSREQWVRAYLDEPGARPQDSRVALADGDEPIGFVTVSDDWIDQVGVVPEWRGRGLGAHLVARSLTALRRAGSREVWLCVHVDNPARSLYERMGFRANGTRARYEDRATIARATITAGLPGDRRRPRRLSAGTSG